MFGIRREQGRLAELAAVERAFAPSDAHATSAWRPGFAALLAELGMEAEARRELERVRERGLRTSFAPALWLASLTYLTDACAAVGDDADGRARSIPSWRRSPGGNVVIGHGVACYGAADRYLGMLAATLGDHDRALEHFEQRAGVQPRDGRHDLARPHAVRVRADSADARPAGDDAAQAPALLSEAATLAERIGMPTLLARARRRSGRGAVASEAPPDEPLLARGGDPAARRGRPQQPRDRRGALHQRTHGRQSRAQHPAQDRRREPHRGRRLRVPQCPARRHPTRGRIAPCPCTSSSGRSPSSSR